MESIGDPERRKLYPDNHSQCIKCLYRKVCGWVLYELAQAIGSICCKIAAMEFLHCEMVFFFFYKQIKDVLSRLEKVDKILMDANKVTLGELDKVDKKLTSADEATLAKLDKVNKNLTNVDKATLDKLDKVDRRRININQAPLTNLIKLN